MDINTHKPPVIKAIGMPPLVYVSFQSSCSKIDCIPPHMFLRSHPTTAQQSLEAGIVGCCAEGAARQKWPELTSKWEFTYLLLAKSQTAPHYTQVMLGKSILKIGVKSAMNKLKNKFKGHLRSTHLNAPGVKSLNVPEKGSNLSVFLKRTRKRIYMTYIQQL